MYPVLLSNVKRLEPEARRYRNVQIIMIIYGNTKRPSMHFIINYDWYSATMLQLALHGESDPEFPMGEIPLGQQNVQNTKYKYEGGSVDWTGRHNEQHTLLPFECFFWYNNNIQKFGLSVFLCVFFGGFCLGFFWGEGGHWPVTVLKVVTKLRVSGSLLLGRLGSHRCTRVILWTGPEDVTSNTRCCF